MKKDQVKTSKQEIANNTYQVNLRVLGGNAKKSYVHKKGNEIKYDLLFILCNNGDRYLIPKNVIKDLVHSITVGKTYVEYKI